MGNITADLCGGGNTSPLMPLTVPDGPAAGGSSIADMMCDDAKPNWYHFVRRGKNLVLVRGWAYARWVGGKEFIMTKLPNGVGRLLETGTKVVTYGDGSFDVIAPNGHVDYYFPENGSWHKGGVVARTVVGSVAKKENWKPEPDIPHWLEILIDYIHAPGTERVALRRMRPRVFRCRDPCCHATDCH